MYRCISGLSTHPAWPCSPAYGPCQVWWVLEHGAGWTADGTASNGHGAGSASHRIASCAITPAYTYMLPCWLIWRKENTNFVSETSIMSIQSLFLFNMMQLRNPQERVIIRQFAAGICNSNQKTNCWATFRDDRGELLSHMPSQTL